jgi:hypothetical protein
VWYFKPNAAIANIKKENAMLVDFFTGMVPCDRRGL